MRQPDSETERLSTLFDRVSFKWLSRASYSSYRTCRKWPESLFHSRRLSQRQLVIVSCCRYSHLRTGMIRRSGSSWCRHSRIITTAIRREVVERRHRSWVHLCILQAVALSPSRLMLHPQSHWTPVYTLRRLGTFHFASCLRPVRVLLFHHSSDTNTLHYCTMSYRQPRRRIYASSFCIQHAARPGSRV